MGPSLWDIHLTMATGTAGTTSLSYGNSGPNFCCKLRIVDMSIHMSMCAILS